MPTKLMICTSARLENSRLGIGEKSDKSEWPHRMTNATAMPKKNRKKEKPSEASSFLPDLLRPG